MRLAWIWIALWNAITISALVIPGFQWWSLLAAIPAFMWGRAMFDYRRRQRHGSDRSTQADHQDPQASGTTFPFATGGTLTSTSSTFSFASQSSREDPGLEVIHDDMPILAHRYAKIVHGDGKFMFASVTGNKHWFEVDADATCLRYLDMQHMVYGKVTLPRQHEAPAEDCECGFYAVPADLLPNYAGYGGVPLLVELSGTVIEHEHGYRAGHQRVVEASTPRCSGCGESCVRAWVQPVSEPRPNLQMPGVIWDCGTHEFMGIETPGLWMAVSLDQVSRSLGVPFVSPPG